MGKVIEITRTLSFTQGQSVLELCYLIAAILFVFGLKMLSHPQTARKGNLWAGFGMVLAIIATIVLHKDDAGNGIKNIGWILGGIGIGTVSGWIIARRIKMTAMPQLVSLFNGTGGAAAALISLREFPNMAPSFIEAHGMLNGQVLVILLGLMIGSVSFTGSMVAYGKLDDRISDIRSSLLKYVNIALLFILIGFIVYIMSRGTVSPAELMPAVYIMLTVSLLYGVLFVMPIGGADMPVVISLLNSFTGIAAALGGFLYKNQAMLLGGILVGSAGIILTMLMCKAMNRSLFNVIVGAFGGSAAGVDKEKGAVKEISASDLAILLSYSQRVIIVPGYGLNCNRDRNTNRWYVGLGYTRHTRRLFPIKLLYCVGCSDCRYWRRSYIYPYYAGFHTNQQCDNPGNRPHSSHVQRANINRALHEKWTGQPQTRHPVRLCLRHRRIYRCSRGANVSQKYPPSI